jgi:hypothetical protein
MLFCSPSWGPVRDVFGLSEAQAASGLIDAPAKQKRAARLVFVSGRKIVILYPESSLKSVSSIQVRMVLVIYTHFLNPLACAIIEIMELLT